MQGRTVLKFTLEARWEEPDSGFVETVPLLDRAVTPWRFPPWSPQQRKQLLYGGAGPGAAGVRLLRPRVHAPQGADRRAGDAAGALKTVNTRSRAITRGAEGEMDQQLALYRQQLELAEGLIPSDEELPNLLDAISAEAQRTGVELTLIQPVGATEEQYYTRRVYDMAVVGELPPDRRVPDAGGVAAAHRDAHQPDGGPARPTPRPPARPARAAARPRAAGGALFRGDLRDSQHPGGGRCERLSAPCWPAAAALALAAAPLRGAGGARAPVPAAGARPRPRPRRRFPRRRCTAARCSATRRGRPPGPLSPAAERRGDGGARAGPAAGEHRSTAATRGASVATFTLPDEHAARAAAGGAAAGLGDGGGHSAPPRGRARGRDGREPRVLAGAAARAAAPWPRRARPPRPRAAAAPPPRRQRPRPGAGRARQAHPPVTTDTPRAMRLSMMLRNAVFALLLLPALLAAAPAPPAAGRERRGAAAGGARGAHGAHGGDGRRRGALDRLRPGGPRARGGRHRRTPRLDLPARRFDGLDRGGVRGVRTSQHDEPTWCAWCWTWTARRRTGWSAWAGGCASRWQSGATAFQPWSSGAAPRRGRRPAASRPPAARRPAAQQPARRAASR